MASEVDFLQYVRDLVAAYPQIESVWLFGSRANGTRWTCIGRSSFSAPGAGAVLDEQWRRHPFTAPALGTLLRRGVQGGAAYISVMAKRTARGPREGCVTPLALNLRRRRRPLSEVNDVPQLAAVPGTVH